MSLEVFVRASGAVMGLARDSFGLDVGQGGGVVSTSSGPASGLAAAVWGSGQAAWAFNNESNVVDGHVSVLGEQDVVANSDLVGALAAAGAGRQQMESVIAAALSDINSLAATTTTPAGQQALVNALAGRLEQTWQTLTNGNADASTRAASSAQLAAAYSGLGAYPGTASATTVPMASSTVPMASSMAAMSPMQNASMLTAETMAANQAVLAQATQLANTHQPSPTNNTNPTTTPNRTTTDAGSQAAAIPVSTVRYDRSSFASGKAACTEYINQTLNLMGITDQTARNNWMNGLLVGIPRESSYTPSQVNDWDSNAVGPPVSDGYPSGCSRGLMQTIPTIFAAHHQPGTSTNIYDPVANIAAGMNYLMSPEYHVLRTGANLPAVHQFNPNDAPGAY
jgi:hypothetical protein